MPSNDFSHINDAELLNNYLATTDNKWLGILLQRYTLMLFGVGMKYLKDEEAAKDVVQQVFLKVIKELPKYKVSYFKSWIYMIAKNHCLMQLRNKNITTTELPLHLEATEAADSQTKNELEEKEIYLTKMEEALAKLNTDQKICIELFYLHKKTYQQIAAEQPFDIKQVKSHIQNGKRNLKIIMESNES